jgi:type II secretory ATPase GspE/PulE/Tfp pilus assembly ATPase PilB-like protein
LITTIFTIARFYGQLHRILVDEVDRPFRFLDIACGDASATVDALKGTRVAHYYRAQIRLDFADLGFDEIANAALRSALVRPNGMVLVTGPTGSGKTTTLYAALAALNSPEFKLMTVEDPVEYQLPGIEQVQVSPSIGLTFARALRSFLRHNPNIVMVGEIRDLETAEVAVQVALTGHLLLSSRPGRAG